MESLTTEDLVLIKTILLDHVSNCMRLIKEIDISGVGQVLWERQEAARALKDKINGILLDMEDDEADK